MRNQLSALPVLSSTCSHRPTAEGSLCAAAAPAPTMMATPAMISFCNTFLIIPLHPAARSLFHLIPGSTQLPLETGSMEPECGDFTEISMSWEGDWVAAGTTRAGLAAATGRQPDEPRSAEPQQCLYFLPLPHGQRSLRPTLRPGSTRAGFGNGSSRPLQAWWSATNRLGSVPISCWRVAGSR